MDSSSNCVTSCRLCLHYNPEGRRVGSCARLNVPVLSSWDACSLATHPFDSSYQPNHLGSFLNESFHENSSISYNTEVLKMQNAVTRSLSLSEH